MQLARHILLNIHLVAAVTWVGAVFMGAFIDWPVARQSVPKGEFPFRFIVGQGNRVFYPVYTGMVLIWISGIGLTLLNPPQTVLALTMVLVKVFALLVMTGFTLYGSLSSWPKLQMATHKEALKSHRYYIYRAMTTYVMGILGSVLGSILSRS
jgi:uncharacterized membrane protein